MGGRVPLGLMKRVVYVVCKHMMRTLHYMEDDVCNVQACGGGLRHFTPSDEGLDIAGIVVWTFVNVMHLHRDNPVFGQIQFCPDILEWLGCRESIQSSSPLCFKSIPLCIFDCHRPS